MSVYKHMKVEHALHEHADLLKKVREVCKSDIEKDPEQFNDDLFLVRFCLSHKGDPEKTANAVKSCIEWRTKHKELLAKLATGWKHPDEVTVMRYTPVALHGHLRDRSPLFIVRSGIGNPDKLCDEHTPETIKNALVFSKEHIYQICMAETRKVGYIVKMVAIQDMKHGSIFDMNRKFVGVLGEASKEMELMYPQLVGASVICNPLSSVKVLMGLAQAILPASMFEKIRLCGGKSTVTGDVSTCPIVNQVFDLNELPTFLGGKCTCSEKGGCIAGVPNDQKEKVTPMPIVPPKV